MKMQTLQKKIDILEHVFAQTAGAYYNINLTQNLVPGEMYQVIDGKEYSINKRAGLPQNAAFTQVTAYWGSELDENEKTAYFEFFSISHLLEQYQNGQTHVKHTYWTKNTLREPMLAEQHVVMFADEENSDVLAISYILDQTVRYREKQDREDAISENKMKTKFLSAVSHDIRTPLNGILGMLEIADTYADDIKKQAECREKTWIAANYLMSLVNNVLDLNHLETDSISLSQQPFNLIDLLMHVTAMTEMQTNAQGIRSIVDWKPGYITHRHLIGSAEGLSRVLMNLNSNAIKYNKKGGTLYCRCKEIECDGDTAWYEIINADTGIGMDEAFLEHAFDAFSQRANTSLDTLNGVGLGLAIVKKTIDKMGGTIRVESQPDRGTRYTILLPFRIDHDPKVQSKPINHISLEGVKALLVEDNELNFEIAKFHLENEGIQVFAAENGKQAVDMFEQSEVGSYDIILMDIMMPVMDGLEATRQIRRMNRPDAAAIPIIAMSANAFEQDIQMSLEAGLDAHLTKPIDAPKVIETMKTFLANKIR